MMGWYLKALTLGHLPRQLTDAHVLHFFFNRYDHFALAQRLWPVTKSGDTPWPSEFHCGPMPTWKFCKFKVQKPDTTHRLFLIKAPGEDFNE